MNPYEAPATSEASRKLEQRFADLLLRVRDNGYSLGFYFRSQLKGYAGLAIFFIPCILFWISLNQRSGANLLIGVLMGVLLRDFSLARQQTRFWPIQEKLINWDKVQRVASGEPLV
jgi:hypothetical protein